MALNKVNALGYKKKTFLLSGPSMYLKLQEG